MNVEKPINPGTYPVDLEIKSTAETAEIEEIIATIAEGEHKGERIVISPIGITKKSKAKSKNVLKIAKASRKRNRNR